MITAFNPMAHPVLFDRPERVTPLSAWNEHIPFAMFLIDALRPRRLVELGTHGGGSYCAFCQAIKKLGLEAECYAVDTWQGDSNAGEYGPEVLRELKAHHDGRYGTFSHLLQTTFDDASGQFQSESVDLLHIDGFHSYEAAKHDFDTWLPKVRGGGIILIHDITVRLPGFGVYRFWDELKPRFRTFEFEHGFGLGVVSIGEVPAALAPFFDATPQDAALLRRLFEGLGREISLTVKEGELNKSRIFQGGQRLRIMVARLGKLKRRIFRGKRQAKAS